MSGYRSATTPPYPLTANGALYEPRQAEEYAAMLFRNVDWQPGQIISILGIGEKGTEREGLLRDRQTVAPAFIGAMHTHLKRWAEWHGAAFIVPAVVRAPDPGDKGDVRLDKIAALTAIVLDLDSGDVTEKAEWVQERLGRATMIVASGGTTEEGKLKAHLYWLLSEPCEDVERVALIRKLLAAKVGGDRSFGRATQVIRIPGSVHAKHGKATLCRILDRAGAEYDFEDLAEIIETMQPMPGCPATLDDATLDGAAPRLTLAGGMDFSPRQDTAIAALHRDVNEGGDALNRWGEFSKVAGFHIAEIRAGRLTPEAAYTAVNGWMLAHMTPPWPQARFDQEFKGLLNRDRQSHGPMPAAVAPWSNVAAAAALPLEYFGDIKPCLKNSWLVRGFLVQAGLATIYGYPGSGKSFLAIDMALRIAAGWPVDGHAVRQSPVIYVAAEGPNGVRKRVAAFRQHHGVRDDLPFALVPCAVNLLEPQADIRRLIQKIGEAAKRLGAPPGLIVIDTLAATFGGGDENTSAMVVYMNNLARMRDEFGATVALVHHRPKDALNNTPRGHSSLMGAMDTIILVEYGVVRCASVTKQKDAEAGTPLGFELKSVMLGTDEEGEPVTAAVVHYRPAQTEKIPPAADIALQALCAAISAAGGSPVSEASWRAKWAENPEVAAQSDETRRKAWQRNRDRLRSAGRARVDLGEWSIPDPGGAAQPMDFGPGAGA